VRISTPTAWSSIPSRWAATCTTAAKLSARSRWQAEIPRDDRPWLAARRDAARHRTHRRGRTGRGAARSCCANGDGPLSRCRSDAAARLSSTPSAGSRAEGGGTCGTAAHRRRRRPQPRSTDRPAVVGAPRNDSHASEFAAAWVRAACPCAATSPATICLYEAGSPVNPTPSSVASSSWLARLANGSALERKALRGRARAPKPARRAHRPSEPHAVQRPALACDGACVASAKRAWLFLFVDNRRLQSRERPRSDTRRATAFSARSRNASSPYCVPATRSHASAATSSSCSPKTLPHADAREAAHADCFTGARSTRVALSSSTESRSSSGASSVSHSNRTS